MNFYNEMMDANDGVRAHYKAYDEWLKATPPERIARKRAEADLAFHRVGITFAVYGEEAGKERLIPFDIIPRIIPPRSTCSCGMFITIRKSSRPASFPPSRY
jgi:uncharacterized circularly permuted ATP-grasp superfamily protein